MLETSCKVGLQPEGGNYRHSETVILIKFVNCFEKRKDNNNKVLAIIEHVIAKFATQWLFVFYFPEILLVTLN